VDELKPLNPVEVRVLGSLVEKEIATPDYYPLSLNGLTNACNQSSNRDPVVSFDEPTVVRGLDSLREKKLAYMVTGAESRVPKYGHRLAESFELTRAETAVLCVLMLRGPQTVGEIRGRTGRMYEFPSLEEADATLQGLVTRTTPHPLVVRLPRQTGLKEQRYAHLLAGEVSLPELETASRVEPAVVAVRFENERLARLEAEIVALRAEGAELRRQFAEFKKQFE
jgi:uncharacterized protein YceH (UPF0502 family)